ncbi:hypothetical protein BJ322DRAFT_1074864 [Thelephora terrestris]|uniref:VWFA domain-containing protein n=1 Tax=Thelephora terrestris TaxID=56493 RepID=A0A9P6H9C1_9AGAM|nr:hypothetical protein BJ322DRAFT_1074864 [Thelephora terrestris]
MSAKPRNLASSSEDSLQCLVNYDVIILMDDSGSMGDYWDQATDVMERVTEVAMKYDTDGIEIQFLNSNKGRIVKSKADVKSLFEKVEPSCLTPLGKRLDDICRDYLRKLEMTVFKPPKRCLIIAITDGSPGNCRFATKFLKELDDEFEKRDIVDTVPYDGVDLTPEQMVKILVGAINRRVDNQKE